MKLKMEKDMNNAKIYLQEFKPKLFCIFLSFIQFINIFWILNEFLEHLSHKMKLKKEKDMNSSGPKQPTTQLALPAHASGRAHTCEPSGLHA
jgi:hypothetical protein